MEEKKDKLHKLMVSLGGLVFAIPIIILVVIPHIYLPLKARFGFLIDYGFWYRYDPEFSDKFINREYYTNKARDVKFEVVYDKDDLDWGEGYADYYYSKDYISFVKEITDKYYDDALVIDNFSVTETQFYWHNSMNVNTFEDYCKVGIRHPMWIYLSEDDDLSKVDEMIDDIKNSVTYQNLSVAVLQVPDNIYEVNKGIDIYTDEDGLEEEFIKTVGTADFRTVAFNDYVVAQWNCRPFGKVGDYIQDGVYAGYVIDIVEKENSYGHPHHYANIASTPDSTDYITVYVFHEEDISIGDKVYVEGYPAYDFDENHVVTSVSIKSRDHYPEINTDIDTSEYEVQSVQVLLDELGEKIEQPVCKLNGKLIYVDNEFRLYHGYFNSKHYYSLSMSSFQDINSMLSHVNEKVCIEGVYMFDNEQSDLIISARLVED